VNTAVAKKYALYTILFASIFYGSTSKANEDNSKPQTPIFKIGVTELPDSLHPYESEHEGSPFTLFFYQRPLVYIDDLGKIECSQCTQAPTFDNKQVDRRKNKQRSYLVANWRIRKDARWGDGRAVTVKDVLFTWDIITSLRAHGSTNLEQFSNIDSIVEHGNPREFQITYYQLSSDYDQLDNFFLLPAHIEQPIWEASKKNLKTYLRDSIYNQDPANPGLYNGPFIVSRFTKDQSLQLKHNAQFYEPSKLSSIFIWKLKGINELKWAYRNNAIHMIPEGELSLSETIDMQKNLKQKEINADIKMVDSHRMNQFMFNLRNPILSNRQMRSAITHAIDKKSLINKVFQDGVKISKHPFDPNNEKEISPNYSPSKSKQILDQLGWAQQDKAPYRTKDNNELSLSIDYPENDEDRAKVAEEIADQLKKVGIHATIKGHSAKTYFSKFIARAEFRDTAIFSWLTTPKQLPHSILHSGEVPTYQNDYEGQNLGAWRSDEVDGLLNDFILELDDQKRAEIVEQVFTIWQQEYPFIPLYYEVKTSVLDPKLKGFKLFKSSLPASMSSEYWSYK